jgi:hypothetical protein
LIGLEDAVETDDYQNGKAPFEMEERDRKERRNSFYMKVLDGAVWKGGMSFTIP